jgi:hypothetical protein
MLTTKKWRLTSGQKMVYVYVHTGCVRKNETPAKFFTNSSINQKVFILEKKCFYKSVSNLSGNKLVMLFQNFAN